MYKVGMIRSVLRLPLLLLLLGDSLAVALEADDNGGLALGAADLNTLLDVVVANVAHILTNQGVEILQGAEELIGFYKLES
jgi:hypothetical protein